MKRICFTLAPLVLAIAAAVYLFLAPIYSGFNGNGPTHATLIQVNGTWAIVPVMFPVVLAAIPLVFRTRAVRIVAAVLLCAFSFITFSIGLFYMPAAVASVLAAGVGADANPARP